MKRVLFLFLLNLGLIVAFNGPHIPKCPFPIGRFFDPFGGFWNNSETVRKKCQPLVEVIDALSSKVTITYDENMIPTIEAENEEDLFFAQGYVLAKNRLWQIDFSVRASVGKVSEIIGEKALDYDRLKRRTGMFQTVISMESNLKQYPKIYRILEAYCAGVNKYIDSLNYDIYPIEFKLLGYQPQEFTVQDILSIELLIVDDMGGTSFAEDLTLDLYSLGEPLFNILFPLKETVEEPVVKITEKMITSARLDRSAPDKIAVDKEELIGDSLTVPASIAEQNKIIAASNNWSIAKGRTSNRSSTIMASDPHLKMNLPSIWYIVHLKCPTIEVLGYSIPGIPAVLIGVNKNISWGITNGAVCTQGWYKVKFQDESKKEYFYDNEWRQTKFIKEEIRIKNQPSFYEEVAYTHYGPVVYDSTFVTKNGLKNLALKWNGHKLDREVETLYLLAKAKNYEDFERAFDHFAAPILNISFASKDGDIAMFVVGDFPLLWPGQTRFIMPGDSSKYDWDSNVSRKHNPRLKNPSSSFVSSANQKATCEKYPYFYHHYKKDMYRHRRIYKSLSDSKLVKVADVMRLQNDNYNQAAEESIDLIKSSIDINKLSAIEKKYYEILTEWNLYNEIDSIGASIFREWQNQLKIIMWVELCPCQRMPMFYRTISILKNDELLKNINLGKYHSKNAVIHEAFSRAIVEIEEWKKNTKKEPIWMNYRVLKIEHMLGKSLAPFGRYNLRIGGGEHIINANEGTQGASMRMIVEFADKAYVWLSYPGGQSGNPGSLFYDNMIDGWEKGQYFSYSL